ncbi:MAG: phosphoribosylglycinamide formyltransferase [Chthoniobacterales bacterium]
MRALLRLGVLGSGKGSNFRAIMESINDGKLLAEVRIVISDVEDAGILTFARDYQIPALYVHPGKYRTKLELEVEQDIVRLLQEAAVEFVVLAGFMRVVKEPLLEAFSRRIINIHPSLLPKFPGLGAWKQALDAGEQVTGCTVHYVDSGVDTGPIIAQRKVPILPGDTAEMLHARIQQQEHELLPTVLQQIAGGAPHSG